MPFRLREVDLVQGLRYLGDPWCKDSGVSVSGLGFREQALWFGEACLLVARFDVYWFWGAKLRV